MSRDMLQGALAPPPPRQLPFDLGNPSSISLPPPAPIRGHQRSRTAADLPPLFVPRDSSSPTRSSTFLPFLRPQSTRSLSPERASVADTVESAGSARESVTRKRPGGTVERLASWFDGASDPVNITLVPTPRKEKLDPVLEAGNMESLFSASQESLDNLTRRPQKKPSLPGYPTSNPSRFSFFRKSTVSLSPDTIEGDELTQLDIQQALFPHGHPDEFSPAALKNLQLNADGTIRRFQQAYIDQQTSLKAVTSARNVLADDLEAAQTRNEHLKMQLKDMAERAAEQEKTVEDLRAQFAIQKPSLESRQSQQHSIRMVPQDGAGEIDSTRTRYRRNRSSDVSSCGESELGSDVSSVISIFSEALSAAPSHATSISSPVLTPMAHRDECSKCHGHGGHATEAWDVVNMMKMESTALKQRISQLENAQDDALDFLSGLKLT